MTELNCRHVLSRRRRRYSAAAPPTDGELLRVRRAPIPPSAPISSRTRVYVTWREVSVKITRNNWTPSSFAPFPSFDTAATTQQISDVYTSVALLADQQQQ